MEHKEKKVEYIELIYDLIFVYIVGRNNGLLHIFKDGFIDPQIFLTYALTALIMLQIWYQTTLFINRYGKNDKRMYVGIFVNMYLLYFMAEGIRSDWQAHYLEFNLSWALILINIALLYFTTLLGSCKNKSWEHKHIKTNIAVLLIQAVIVIASIPIYNATKFPIAPLAMVFGIVSALISTRKSDILPVEFNHLTERVMLYVVFTFGEMIIGIADYFEGGFTLNTIYFSLSAFLIVAGLFMSYGTIYDHIIDRNLHTNGAGYMMIHVFFIFSLNHITAALEFMRQDGVKELPKNIFLVASFVMFFVLLFAICHYRKAEYKSARSFRIKAYSALAAFVALMMIFYKNPRISIAITIIFIWSFYFLLLNFKNKNIPDKV